MRDPQGFSLLADALMAGLASRSHEWSSWEIAESESWQNGEAHRIDSWLRVGLRSGPTRVLELRSDASPSKILESIFDHQARAISPAWPSFVAKLGEALDPRPGTELEAPRGSWHRYKSSTGEWRESFESKS